MKHYGSLFQEIKIGRRYAKNRIVLSPMGDMMANIDGSPSEQMIAYYSERAKGGVGIITPGVVCVDYPRGKAERLAMRVDIPEIVKDLERLAESVQRYGALFIPQLHHAGAQTMAINTGGNKPYCVSDKADVNHIEIREYRKLGGYQELTTDQVKQLIQKFIRGAVNCKDANCDGVTIHGAHGYLISQFLSPDTNARTDEYGGSFNNRIRFAVEIVSGIRQACGPDFILGARIPGKEWVPNGLSDDECIEIAKALEAAGCDYLDVSYGVSDIESRLLETEKSEQGNRVMYAERIKAAVSIPVGTVGLLKDPGYCDDLIKEKRVDFVSIGRALICDPYWPKKAQEGRIDDIRPCITCLDGCMKRSMDGKFTSCALNPLVGRENSLGNIQKTDHPKSVVVIGGGPAGMQAAISASDKGHNVTLLESADKLGGQLNLASIPPHKSIINKATEWYEHELKKRNIDLKLNCTASFDTIDTMKPDLIIAATGALPITEVPIEGLDKTVQAWDIISGNKEMPKNMDVTIIGGGIVACETAQMLIRNGNTVTIVEMLPQIATGLEFTHMEDLQIDFAEYNVSIHTETMARKVTDTCVTCIKDGKENIFNSDMVILAAGQKSAGLDLVKQLRDGGYDVRIIGDAKRPSKIINATLDGFYAGIDI